jgi:uncharacterized lipoprotein YmbA
VINHYAGIVLIVLAGLLEAACSTTPSARFYTLDAGTARPPMVQRSELVVAIGPIDLPEYLNRPQIVTRAGDNRLSVDEFNRWGGRLEEEITRVLARRIGPGLGTQHVYSYPSRIAPDADFRIGLDIRSFDGARGGQVGLDVAWSLIDDRSGAILLTRQTHYRGQSTADDYAAYAAALSATLEQLGDDMVETLRGLKR